MIRALQHLVGSSDTSDATLRTQLGVPDVVPSQVGLVANDSICVRAAQAFDELADTTVSGRRVYVVEVGTVYVVVEPGAFNVHRTPLMIFDSSFAYKSTLLL